VTSVFEPVRQARLMWERTQPQTFIEIDDLTTQPPFEILSTCSSGGYLYCRTRPQHPRANAKGLYAHHRVVAENALGRLLEPGEVVHHVDGNKINNDPENLQVLDNSEHSRLHRPEIPPAEAECSSCGRAFVVKPHELRLRLKRTKSGLYCSLSCAGSTPAGAIQTPKRKERQ